MGRTSLTLSTTRAGSTTTPAAPAPSSTERSDKAGTGLVTTASVDRSAAKTIAARIDAGPAGPETATRTTTAAASTATRITASLRGDAVTSRAAVLMLRGSYRGRRSGRSRHVGIDLEDAPL